MGDVLAKGSRAGQAECQTAYKPWCHLSCKVTRKPTASGTKFQARESARQGPNAEIFISALGP